jgi:hypothetical protein
VASDASGTAGSGGLDGGIRARIRAFGRSGRDPLPHRCLPADGQPGVRMGQVDPDWASGEDSNVKVYQYLSTDMDSPLVLDRRRPEPVFHRKRRLDGWHVDCSSARRERAVLR